MSPERVRRVLEAHLGAHEVCFTSGEPTTHPKLADFVALARGLGYRRVSLMTNARRLGYERYAAALVAAGLNRVYVSIHGHTRALHEGLTRTPGSFEQTLAGLRAMVRLARARVEINTSTVLTRRNVEAQLEIYEMLEREGVGQIVFDALQVNGRAETFFDQVVPRYAEVRRGFERLLDRSSDGGARAYLVDVPPCVTEGLPDARRGYMEEHMHYEPGDARKPGVPVEPSSGEEGEILLRRVRTAELDCLFRSHGEACGACRYRGVCPGAYLGYTRRFGWQELVPVAGAPLSSPGR
jgi:cyclic pyranopterin phosphate synthase